MTFKTKAEARQSMDVALRVKKHAAVRISRELGLGSPQALVDHYRDLLRSAEDAWVDAWGALNSLPE